MAQPDFLACQIVVPTALLREGLPAEGIALAQGEANDTRLKLYELGNLNQAHVWIRLLGRADPGGLGRDHSNVSGQCGLLAGKEAG
jgi:hypothetical protein